MRPRTTARCSAPSLRVAVWRSGKRRLANEGLELAREHHPDVIVLDLEAEQLDAAAIREQFAAEASGPEKSLIVLGKIRRGPVLYGRTRDQQTLPLRTADSYNRAVGGQSGVSLYALPLQALLRAWQRCSYCKVVTRERRYDLRALPLNARPRSQQSDPHQRQRDFAPPRRNSQR